MSPATPTLEELLQAPETMIRLTAVAMAAGLDVHASHDVAQAVLCIALGELAHSNYEEQGRGLAYLCTLCRRRAYRRLRRDARGPKSIGDLVDEVTGDAEPASPVQASRELHRLWEEGLIFSTRLDDKDLELFVQFLAELEKRAIEAPPLAPLEVVVETVKRIPADLCWRTSRLGKGRRIVWRFLQWYKDPGFPDDEAAAS